MEISEKEKEFWLFNPATNQVEGPYELKNAGIFSPDALVCLVGSEAWVLLKNLQSPKVVIPPNENMDLIKLFVGEKYPYYQNKWTIINSGGSAWNWWVLLFGPLWFFYRKMYLLGTIMLGCAIIIDVILDILDASNSVSYAIGLGVPLIWADFANSLYQNHVKKIVNYWNNTSLNKQSVTNIICQKGGTTLVAPILVLLVLLVLLCVIAFFVIINGE